MRVRSAARAFIVIALSLAFLVLIGPPMFETYATAYTGVHAGPLGTPPNKARIVVDAGSPAYRAGLRSGDAIRCMSPRDSEMLFPSWQPAAYNSSPIRICYVRDGVAHHIAFIARPGPLVTSLYGSLAFIILRLAAYAVFLVVGATLVMARPSLMTWMFFFYCLSTAPAAVADSALTTLPSTAYIAFRSVFSETSAIGSAFLLLFTLSVPDQNLPSGWRRWAFWITCAATAVMAAYTLYHEFHVAAMVAVEYDPIRQLFTRALVYAVVVVTLARLMTMRAQDRARFAWVAAGIVVGVIANDLRNNVKGGEIGTLAGTFAVFMPLALMYAILRRHVIDVRFVISRTVVYGVVTTLMIGVIAAVDWATSAYLSQLRVALAIDAFVTIGLGVALHRTYGVIEDAVDFLIYRKKHAAETYLKRLARTLLRAELDETVDRALVQDPFDKLDLGNAALFRKARTAFILSRAIGWESEPALAFAHDHDLVRFLVAERRRLHVGDLHAHVTAEFLESGAVPAVAVPIFEGDAMEGFAVYGLHRDGTKLDPDEIDTLENLCETAAQAYVRIENIRLRALLESSLKPPHLLA